MADSFYMSITKIIITYIHCMYVLHRALDEKIDVNLYATH